jgi:hypothetical protein
VFPGQRYLARLVDANVPIIVNSDAHVPALINAGRAEGFAMLDRAIAEQGLETSYKTTYQLCR